MTIVTSIADLLLDLVKLIGSPYILTTFIAIVMAVLSLRMMAIAYRGVPNLGAPRCAHCGHLVSTPDCERCAECGALLSGAMLAYGWRHRSWRRAVVATIVMVAGGVLVLKYPGLPEVVFDRALLRGSVALGLTRPDVINEVAGSLRARLTAGANDVEITDELLAALGPSPAIALAGSSAAQELLWDLGSRAIAREDTERIDALANASHLPQKFAVRRRHHPLQEVCIDVDGSIGSGGAGFITVLLPLPCTIDGEAQTPNILNAGIAYDDGHGYWCDGRWKIRAPATLGAHTLKIAWQQVVLPALVLRTDGSADTRNAVWTRNGTFDTMIEVVESNEPVTDAIDAPEDNPWSGEIDALQRLELRDVDERMLVSVTIKTTLTPGLTIAGRWFAIQDGLERALHADTFRRRPSNRYSYHGWCSGESRLSFIRPRIDPTRPFTLVYRPNPDRAEIEAASSCDRRWTGATEFTITPDMLTRETRAADPTWVLAKK